MSYLLTLSIMLAQAGDVPPDPLAPRAGAPAAGAAEDLLRDPADKAAPPDAGGLPQEFKPATPGAPVATPAAEGSAPAAADPSASASAEPEIVAPQRTWREWWDGLRKSGALGLMIDGGFFMWPIFAMGVLSVGVMIERWRTLKMLNIDTTGLRQQVRELVQADRAEEALEICSRERGPSAAVLTAGLRRYLLFKRLNAEPAKIERETEKAMNDYGTHIVAALEKHLPILASISNVAPMVGSVGTVWGMIILFQDIVVQFGTVNIILAAAAGIKLKLLVTVWGLIVGIPCFVAHNYFTTVVGGYVLSVEEAATELTETIALLNAAASLHSTGSNGDASGVSSRHAVSPAMV